MNRTTERPAQRPVRKAAVGAAFLLLGAVAAAAQGLELPVPDVSVSAASRQLELVWPELTGSAGRSVSNFQILGFDSLSSDVSGDSLAGEYVLDCDFRLSISRIPNEGFGTKVGLVYKLQLNTTGVGSPFAIDTLRIQQADSIHFFDPRWAANLGLSFTANYDQPGHPLGGVPVTVSGLSAGKADTARVHVVVENSNPVTFPIENLLVRVIGPYVGAPNQVTLDSLMVVTQAGVPVEIQNGMYLTFGAGSAAPGDSTSWKVRHVFPVSEGLLEADLQAFEGYHVWRSDLPGVESDFTLMGEIRQCDSKFFFVLVNLDEFTHLDIDLIYDPVAQLFTLVDRDLHDDFPYRYAVSTFDRDFLGNPQGVVTEGELGMTPKIYPAPQQVNPNARAYVVPNPFKRSAAWQEGEAKVVFANLPPACTIRIYTVAGDHVTTLQHRFPGEPRSTSPTTTSWNLASARGEDIVPGIYIYYIESADGFQQTGKMIIAR